MNIRTVGLAVFTACALVVSACGSTDGAGGDAPAAAETDSQSDSGTDTPANDDDAGSSGALDHVIASSNYIYFGNDAFWFAGLDQGYFEEEGIDLEVVAGQGSTAVSQVVSTGTVDFGVTGGAAATNVASEDPNLQVIAINIASADDGMCYVKDRNTIDSLGDFEGLTIGAAPGDTYVVALQSLLGANGMSPDIFTLENVKAEASLSAVVAGMTDAAPCAETEGWSTFKSIAEGEGHEPGFFSLADAGLDIYGYVLMTNKDMVDNNPELVERFIRAYTKSMLWSLANPEAAVDALIAHNPNDAFERADALGDMLATVDRAKGPNGYFIFDDDMIESTISFANLAFDKDISSDGGGMFNDAFVSGLSDDIVSGSWADN